MARTVRLDTHRASRATLLLVAVVCAGGCGSNPRGGGICVVATDSDGRPARSARYARLYRELAERGDLQLPKRIDCNLPPPASFVSLVLGDVISYGPEFGPHANGAFMARVLVDSTLVGAELDTLVLVCDDGVSCAGTQLARSRTLHSAAPECALPGGRVILSAIRPDPAARQPSSDVAREQRPTRPLVVDRAYYLDTGALSPGTRLSTGTLEFRIPVDEVCRDGELRADECQVKLTVTDLTLGELVERFVEYYR